MILSVISWVPVALERGVSAHDGRRCVISGCGGDMGNICVYLLITIVSLLDQFCPGLYRRPTKIKGSAYSMSLHLR